MAGLSGGGEVAEGGAASGVGGACHAADIAGCRCADNLPSFRACHDGFFGECHCSSPEPGGIGGSPDGTCLPKQELCDQLDNDCDGVVDNGFPCRDDTLLNTATPTQAAYVAANSITQCADGSLHQVWPTSSPAAVPFRECDADVYRIRRTDEKIFYGAGLPHGIFGASANADPLLLPTPPCDDQSHNAFDLDHVIDFDARGVLHYRCKNALFRGAGELVAGSVFALAGVLDDGRSIVVRGMDGNGSGSQYAVISKTGEELSRFPPPGMFVGNPTVTGALPLSEATSIEGDVAYVALGRRYYPDGETSRSEVMIYEVDAYSIWRFVRRLEANWNAGDPLVVFADGTLLLLTADPDSQSSQQRLVEYLPNNTTRTAWRESSAGFKLAFDAQLIVGPRRH